MHQMYPLWTMDQKISAANKEISYVMKLKNLKYIKSPEN